VNYILGVRVVWWDCEGTVKVYSGIVCGLVGQVGHCEGI